jgi:hypothetical protein
MMSSLLVARPLEFGQALVKFIRITFLFLPAIKF